MIFTLFCVSYMILYICTQSFFVFYKQNSFFMPRPVPACESFNPRKAAEEIGCLVRVDLHLLSNF